VKLMGALGLLLFLGVMAGCDSDQAVPASGSSVVAGDTTTAPPATAAPPDDTTGAVSTSPSVASTAPTPDSFDGIWEASLAALDALGPTRATIVVSYTSPEGGDATSVPARVGTRVQELLDPVGKRARLTVDHSALDSTDPWLTTIRNGRERVTFLQDSSGVRSGTEWFVFLRPSTGLPLPLWVPGEEQDYAELLSTPPISDVGGRVEISGKLVGEQVKNGTKKLSWQRVSARATATVTLTLDADYLPVSIEQTGGGEGDFSYYRVDYAFEKDASFSDSDFSLEAARSASVRSLGYELSRDCPFSEQVDWGQYWLGEQVGECGLVSATYNAFYGDDGKSAEPIDEVVHLLYEKPGAIRYAGLVSGPSESVHVTVRPLRGKWPDESRESAEQRVASGDWTRQELTIAGRPAAVYWGPRFEGDSMNNVVLFMPDAFVEAGGMIDLQTVRDLLVQIDDGG
jgi:hypothetical protein